MFAPPRKVKRKKIDLKEELAERDARFWRAYALELQIENSRLVVENSHLTYQCEVRQDVIEAFLSSYPLGHPLREHTA